MAQIGTQGDASAHQGQTEQCLQRQPGEIKQGPHARAIQLHKGVPASVVLDPGVQVPVQVLGHPQGDAVHQGRHLPVDALHTHDPSELKEGHDAPPVHPVPEELLHHRGEASPRGEGRQVQLTGHLGEVAAVAPREVIAGLAQGQVHHRRHRAGRRPGGGGRGRRRGGPGGRGCAARLGGQDARRGSGPGGRGARVSGIPLVAPLRQLIVDVLHHDLSVIVACSPRVRHPSAAERQPGPTAPLAPRCPPHGPARGVKSYNPAISLDVLCIPG
ncbi:TPA: hypothetical protein BOS_22414 [Bos taurus]|nr:TPA: hypothetical protein BOS_22414 [Bos taurus]